MRSGVADVAALALMNRPGTLLFFALASATDVARENGRGARGRLNTNSRRRKREERNIAGVSFPSHSEKLLGKKIKGVDDVSFSRA